MKRAAWITGIVIVILFGGYLLGPKFDEPDYSAELPHLQLNIENVAQYVSDKEAAYNIRPDNEARIVWFNDSLKNQTEYCLLYLHGFSASWYEGNPTHINVAAKLKVNLFLSRLHAHGLTQRDAFAEMKPDELYLSAQEALLIASALGKKVIIIGTSTGGTLALKLAADYPEMVDALILLSPNIEINNPAAFLFAGPWGLNLVKKVGGGGMYRNLGPGIDIENKYWYREYRWEGVIYLQQLIETTMNEKVFIKVKSPVFVGYYYKDEENQDRTVKVDAILDMFDKLGTPENSKHKVAFPNANSHVIGCADLSGCAPEVESEIMNFIHKIVLKDKWNN